MKKVLTLCLFFFAIHFIHAGTQGATTSAFSLGRGFIAISTDVTCDANSIVYLYRNNQLIQSFSVTALDPKKPYSIKNYQDGYNLEPYAFYEYRVKYVLSGQTYYQSIGSIQYFGVPEPPDEEYMASSRGLAIYGKEGDFYDATISIYYANPSQPKLTKPIIIVDGFDAGNLRNLYNAPFNKEDPRGIYAYSNGDTLGKPSQHLIPEMKKRCYDIIFVDWTQGAGDIPSNARLYQNIIQYINQQKATSSGLVLMGPSMGGLITRYALAEMEQKRIDHQCRLFISLDSPHKGANINFGVQLIIGALVGRVNKIMQDPMVSNAKDKLYSTAAMQLVRYHIGSSPITGGSGGNLNVTPEPHSEHINFYKAIESLNGNGGWPEKCLKLAISDGKGLPNNDMYRAGIREVAFSSGFDALKFQTFTAIPGRILMNYAELRSDDYYSMSSGWDGLCLNNAPGSFIHLQSMFNQNDDNGLKEEMKDAPTGSCFMPIPSTLGIAMTKENTHRTWLTEYGDGEITKSEMLALGYVTPFDVCMVQRSNRDHVDIGPDIKNFILKYLDSLDKLQYVELPSWSNSGYSFKDEETTMAAGIVLGSSSRAVSVVVSTGQDYTAIASKYISMRKGFQVEAGAGYHAYISKVESSCFVVPDANYLQYGPPLESQVVPEQEEELGVSISSDYETYLFPNPTRSLVAINVSQTNLGNVILRVSDVSGNEITNQKIAQEKTVIDLSGYSNGVYIFSVADTDKVTIYKIVKTE
ncbi:MAG: T9SS type A sorting domain-containing protein [Flavobacteriales bacterium]